MHLNIRHRTVYRYAPAALRVALRVRLYPPTYDGQKPSAWAVTVNGENVPPMLTDGAGDAEGVWQTYDKIEEVEILAEGRISTENRNGLMSGLKERMRTAVFLRDTEQTRPDDAIRDLALGITEQDPLQRLHALCNAVADAVEYRTGATEAGATAAQVLALGAGVCQDHAHLFIAAARSLGIPARYVSGYMLAGEDATALHETHAWAEAHLDGLGWVGFDCSNRVCPTDAYVRLSSGLDATGAAPVRGFVLGETSETLEAAVDIGQMQQ